jgi:hypothetical protein
MEDELIDAEDRFNDEAFDDFDEFNQQEPSPYDGTLSED